MADLIDIAQRAAFTTQALATMGACPDWDRALQRYLAAEALAFADEEFGPHSRRCHQFDIREHLLKQRAPDSAAVAELTALREADDAEVRVVTERRYEPLWQAQRELAAIAAPSLAAALFKVALIKVAELDNDAALAGDAMTLVEADLARFLG